MTKDDIEQLLSECLLRSETYSLVITDLEGRYIYVNEVFKNRFAFVCNDFIGQPSFIAIYPEDHDKCLQAIEQVFQNPDKVVKVNLRKPDTSINDFYWTHWEFSLFKDHNKNPVGILCLGHDITETEKASRQAKEFAQKVETMIEEITDGFYVLNREWKFIKINTVAEQILGIPREKLLGHTIWDLFPDTPDYNYPTAYRKAMNEYVTVTFEDYRADLDKWFSTVCYSSQEGLTVFFKDITQEKKKQFALEDTTNKLKAILESTHNGYILINKDYKILHFNEVAKIMRYDYVHRILVINQDVRDFISLESKNVLMDLFEKAMQGQATVTEVKRTIQGKETWFEDYFLPVYKEATQELIGVTLKTVNIDDRKQAERKMKEQDYILRAIYNSTTEAITFIDKNFLVRFGNQVAKGFTKQFFGKEAQLGDNVFDYTLPEYQEEFRDYFERVLSGEHITMDYKYNKNYWKLSLYPVYDDEHIIIGIAHNVLDITKRKEKEEVVLKQNEALQQISWQQSHELRRPVASILGLCDLLKNYKNETEEMKSKYIDSMLQAANELDKIIHKIVFLANENEYDK
ncbi:PAS domain-containing protein [Hugenholtzia roseola]|uniref:PAS domain-containing protein n=1 Tax=Hugenholtzia roseola TaxID=1002 RepID=UPI000416B15A|nr:PAS domain S-box protein [Hugenholtzia roseola]